MARVRSSQWGRAGRYAIASVVATVVSELGFVLLYGLGIAGAHLAGMLAFLAGALPKYVLARWWVWQRSGMPELVGEVLPYVIVAAVTGLGAGALTDLAEAAVTQGAQDQPMEEWFAGVAFLASMVVMFAVRFVIFDKWVFTNRRLTGRSRGRRTSDRS
jgi:putative flippase GtrA